MQASPNTIQYVEERISDAEDTIENIDITVKENAKGKNLAQNIQEIQDTMRKPNLRMEMDTFLDRYQVQKLNQNQINYLNIPITPKEIEGALNSLPTKKAQDQMGLADSFIRPSKKT